MCHREGVYFRPQRANLQTFQLFLSLSVVGEQESHRKREARTEVEQRVPAGRKQDLEAGGVWHIRLSKHTHDHAQGYIFRVRFNAGAAVASAESLGARPLFTYSCNSFHVTPKHQGRTLFVLHIPEEVL